MLHLTDKLESFATIRSNGKCLFISLTRFDLQIILYTSGSDFSGKGLLPHNIPVYKGQHNTDERDVYTTPTPQGIHITWWD